MVNNQLRIHYSIKNSGRNEFQPEFFFYQQAILPADYLFNEKCALNDLGPVLEFLY